MDGACEVPRPVCVKEAEKMTCRKFRMVECLCRCVDTVDTRVVIAEEPLSP